MHSFGLGGERVRDAAITAYALAYLWGFKNYAAPLQRIWLDACATSSGHPANFPKPCLCALIDADRISRVLVCSEFSTPVYAGDLALRKHRWDYVGLLWMSGFASGFGSAPSSSGSLAMFAAIRRASSYVSKPAAVRLPGSSSK